MKYELSDHAQEEMRRRGVTPEQVASVVMQPQQVVAAHGGRKAYQSQLSFHGGRMFLVRVIVDDRLYPSLVVTVYRTSKISKYWSTK